MRDQPGNGIRGSCGVGFRMPEERHEITGGGQSNAEHDLVNRVQAASVAQPLGPRDELLIVAALSGG